jgi:alkanesulfonate monooxygenase SsuD/methylene tetrahydromethanopterin reductase-like flavin-dependent oxidoreductase (luciferase family)
MPDLEFGLDTFGDVPEDDSGSLVPYAAAIRQVVDEAVLADQLGVDVFALGEHHRRRRSSPGSPRRHRASASRPE